MARPCAATRSSRPLRHLPDDRGQGGDWFDEETGTYDFTGDAVIETLEFLRGMINDGCMFIYDQGNPQPAFAGLQVPMANGSSVGIPFIRAAIEESGSGLENWSMTTFPWEDERVLQTYLRGVMIVDQSPEENLAAWLFIKFWSTNVEAQVAWTAAANYQPFFDPAREGLTEAFLGERPQFTQVFDLIGDDSVVKYSTPSHPRNNEINAIAGDFFIAAVTGDEDIRELAAEATEEANEVYQRVLEEIADAAAN
ncbi:MAG: extracellular solute-binding protein [Blastochloris sp.]|nr:extracellular solute-binding protein [Blastochloris sp.]